MLLVNITRGTTRYLIYLYVHLFSFSISLTALINEAVIAADIWRPQLSGNQTSKHWFSCSPLTGLHCSTQDVIYCSARKSATIT